jgi:tRNA (guanine26-N2/guanine27-N2)-dimethyltransferase
VFYNPAMAGDRDLAVAFARARFPAGSASGWDMLAATGVRGLRLFHESGGFRSMLLTEANPTAAFVLAENARGYTGCRAVTADAREPPAGAPFDYVDLDPYGSPLPLLETAVAAVRPGGVLAVTATDLMVLAGVQPGACERLYGARPVRGRLGPEGGLRILLARAARTARAAHRTIRPMLAYCRGHHLRAYLEVIEVDAGEGGEPVGTIDPATWEGPSLGPGGPFGPMWLGGLFAPALVSALEVPPTAACPRETSAFLERLRGEAAIDRPFYYEANVLARALGLPSPPARKPFLAALAAEGFRAAPTHARPEGIRTDAPRSVVEAVARRLGGT